MSERFIESICGAGNISSLLADIDQTFIDAGERICDGDATTDEAFRLLENLALALGRVTPFEHAERIKEERLDNW